MNKFTKLLSFITGISVLMQSLFPNRLYASVSGPSSPEFSNFESVNTNNMVNEFTGDFTYNIPVIEIPGSNGGGYSLSLSYHSGVGAEEEPSWVGYGWTLNPGAIIRNKQGFADDINAGTVKYYNKTKTNWSVTAGTNGSIGIRAFGIAASAGLTDVLAYNSYHGLSTSSIPYIGYQLGAKSTTISWDGGEKKYSYSKSSPLSVMMDIVQSVGSLASWSNYVKYGIMNTPSSTLQKVCGSSYATMASGQGVSSSRYGAYTLHNQSIPTTATEYESSSTLDFSAGIYVTPTPLPVGAGGSLFGTINEQTTKATIEPTYYGYMYSGNATANDMMDYSVERPDNFNVKDEILPTPFSGADRFIAVGEGISGMLRLYSNKIGEFHPREITNSSTTASLGVHVNAGPLNISGSLSESVNMKDFNGSSFSISSWDDHGENDDYLFEKNKSDSYFFRFIGDMGGHVSMSSSDWAESANLISNSDEGYVPQLGSSFRTTVNDGEAVGCSSYIGYHTNADMKLKDSNSKHYKRYNQRSDIESAVDRTDDNQIGELAITNKQGNKYVYAMPIYEKNEKNISVSVPSSDSYLCYHSINDADVTTKMGDEIDNSYASSFLLTEITTPNYIDRTLNGPSNDDFGGWTKFNYDKIYGDNGTKDTNYYHWRMPWKGLIHHKNQTSNEDDDMGSFSSGDKEIAYLSSVETDKYIAEFKRSDRLDGLEAEDDNTASSTAGTINLAGNKTLKKLDEIILYAKDKDGNKADVIKRIYFEYDYSLMDDQPNSSGIKGASDSTNKKGKLTLKKLWFEYGDVRNAGISPYLFTYEYPKTSNSTNKIDLPSQYDALDNYGGTNLKQNPNYDEAGIDGWGNYQEDGSNRVSKMMDWNDQTPSSTFDPAAYNLKRITLPSGGEILVQYEQKEYAYVHDRRALAMVPLTSIHAQNYPTDTDVNGTYGSFYNLNLDEIGANNDDDKQAIVDWIQKIYIDGDGRDPQKMYFKFKYDVLECGYEYITGYANVMSVGKTDDGIYVQLGNPNENESNVDGGFSAPCDACLEYFKANKGLDIGQDCGKAAIAQSDDAESVMLQMVDLLSGDYSDNSTTACKTIDVTSSYLRIPLPHAKKGGGPRVKRLLRYTSGLESGSADAAVYGYEYVYETIDGESSGVASNEPAAFREENALVGYLKKRSESTKAQVLVSGEDKSQFEGPVGEFLLPSPSIGYSRVVTKNIYDGTTNDGFSTSEFYTCKDYPYDRTTSNGYSGVEYTDVNKKVSNPNPSFGFLNNKTYYACWATQGTKFVINNMNGQPKKMTTYDGKYDYINLPDSATELASTSYNYFEPGDLIPVMHSNFQFGTKAMGKELEVVTESKKISEAYITSTVTVDAGVAIAFIANIPYTFPTYFRTKDETYLHTYLVNKIIYCPAVTKSVTTFKDGTFSTLLNKYFDPVSGDPIVQEKSGLFDQQAFDNNEVHQGKYTSFNFPAHAYYPYMGKKSGHEKLKIEPSSDLSLSYNNSTTGFFSSTNPNHITFGGDYCDVLDNLTPGDLIAIYSGSSCSGNANIVNVQSISGGKVYVIPTTNFSYYGFADGQCSIEILQSNRANLLTVSNGNLVTYGSFDEPNEIVTNKELKYRKEFADYLNKKENGKSPSMPDDFNYISVIDPNTGDCTQCSTVEESDNSSASVTKTVTNVLENTIGSYNMSEYQGLLNWGTGNAMQNAFLTTTLNDVMDRYNPDGTTSGPSSERTTGKESDYLQADNLSSMVKSLYNQWKQDYYFNGTNISEFLGTQFKTKNVFNSNRLITENISENSVTINTGTSSNSSPSASTSCIFDTYDFADSCMNEVHKTTGSEFFIDDESGKLKYGDPNNPCSATVMSCIKFCNSYDPGNVIAASATIFSNQNDISSALEQNFEISGTDNPFETGQSGKWFAQSTHQYKTDITSMNDDVDHSYEAGIFKDFRFFDWENTNYNHNSNWLTTNETTFCGVDGKPLEEKNLMDIYSVAKYGYDNKVNYLVAYNAEYESVMFEGFEYDYDASKCGGSGYKCFEEMGINTSVTSLSNNYSHSGEKSVKIDYTAHASMIIPIFSDHTKNTQLKDKGFSVKVWIRTPDANTWPSITLAENSGSSLFDMVAFTEIARSGHWKLFEAKVTPDKWVSSSKTSFGAEIIFSASSSMSVYMDDLRMQPIDSKMSAYVYDPNTLRLVAQFDDQHFGTFYQYNKEGKLMRIQSETEEGIKTVKETQYNMPVSANTAGK